MRVLLVEDNPKMADAVRQGLVEQGFVVDVCHKGYEGEEEAVLKEYDLVILDRLLPDRDGVEICRNLRARDISTPILMLTALSKTDQKVDGLDAGADDYLSKPFEFDELVARVRALMRRGSASESRVIKYDELELDLDTRTANRAGQEISLTTREFSLLHHLMRNPDRVLTRQSIYEHVWDMNYEASSNVLDVFISALRRKIDRGFEPPLIHTVIGAGYRFGIVQS